MLSDNNRCCDRLINRAIDPTIWREERSAGFGRAELSLSAIGTTCLALSHGHGFRGSQKSGFP